MLCLLLLVPMACTPAGEPGAERNDDAAEQVDPDASDQDEPWGRYVSTEGDDSAPGTEDEPFGTLEHGLRQLDAGERLIVRGGEYEERIEGVEMPHATEEAPTRIEAYPDEQPVVRGLLWLEGGAHWVLDGIDVTWDPEWGRSDEHMVKVTDGTDWVVRNAEISGARSYAGLLVAGTRTGEPARWELSGNCIRDTVPSNATNQDHNLYVNTGLSAGPGLIEGNLLFGAPNGENLKIGPGDAAGGAADVVVRNNTLYDAVQNVLMSEDSRDNTIERNILGRTAGETGNIVGYRLEGADNVARDNIGFDAASIIENQEGGVGVEDGGGNEFPVDPEFASTDACDGFEPTNRDVNGYGHHAVAR